MAKAKAASVKAAAVWMDVRRLVPWVRNDQIRINDDKVSQMAEILIRNGFQDPIVAWENAPAVLYPDGTRQAAGDRICSGHLRSKATLQLLRDDPSFAWEDSPGPGMVPVRLTRFRSEEHFEEHALAENLHLGEWNTTGRNDLLRELMGKGANIRGIGFGSDLLDGLMAGGKDVRLDTRGGGAGDEGDDDPGEERDDTSGGEGAKLGDGKADVTVVIGVVRFVVDRDQYDAWYERVRERAGFERADIEMEVRRRIEL